MCTYLSYQTRRRSKVSYFITFIFNNIPAVSIPPSLLYLRSLTKWKCSRIIFVTIDHDNAMQFVRYALTLRNAYILNICVL